MLKLPPPAAPSCERYTRLVSRHASFIMSLKLNGVLDCCVSHSLDSIVLWASVDVAWRKSDKPTSPQATRGTHNNRLDLGASTGLHEEEEEVTSGRAVGSMATRSSGRTKPEVLVLVALVTGSAAWRCTLAPSGREAVTLRERATSDRSAGASITREAMVVGEGEQDEVAASKTARAARGAWFGLVEGASM